MQARVRGPERVAHETIQRVYGAESLFGRFRRFQIRNGLHAPWLGSLAVTQFVLTLFVWMYPETSIQYAGQYSVLALLARSLLPSAAIGVMVFSGIGVLQWLIALGVIDALVLMKGRVIPLTLNPDGPPAHTAMSLLHEESRDGAFINGRRKARMPQIDRVVYFCDTDQSQQETFSYMDSSVGEYKTIELLPLCSDCSSERLQAIQQLRGNTLVVFGFEDVESGESAEEGEREISPRNAFAQMFRHALNQSNNNLHLMLIEQHDARALEGRVSVNSAFSRIIERCQKDEAVVSGGAQIARVFDEVAAVDGVDGVPRSLSSPVVDGLRPT